MTSVEARGFFLAFAVEQTCGHLDWPDLLERNLRGLHGFFRSVVFRCGFDPVCCYCEAKPERIGTLHEGRVYKSLTIYLYERIGFVQIWGSHEPLWLHCVGELLLSDVRQSQHRLWRCVVSRDSRCVAGTEALVGEVLQTVFSGQWAPNTCIGGSGTRAIDVQSSDVLLVQVHADIVPSVIVFGLRASDCVLPGPCSIYSARCATHGVVGFGSTTFLPLLDLCWRAPNTCIGGSGTRAVSMSQSHCGTRDHYFYVAWPYAGSVFPGSCSEHWTLWLLGSLQQDLCSFFHSLALLTLFMLVALFVRPFRARNSPLGFVLGGHLVGLQLQPLRACAVATPSTPVLDWRFRGKCKGQKHRGVAGRSRPVGWVLWCLSFVLGSIPERICLQPVFLATWVFAPAEVYAMGRPPQTHDPPPEEYSQRSPHLVPPDELTTHVGNCCYAPLGSFNFSSEDDIRDLAVVQVDPPWGGVQSAEAEGSDWLGVFLHTPHYQTQALAVKPAERNICAVTRVIHKHSPELAAQTFDTIVPLRPQRFAGFASLLRFSSAIRCTGLGGQVAIVFDLTHVGGHYFAAVLPRELSYSALLDYVLPLSNCHGGSPAVYVGGRARPWPPSALVKLSDGDVVNVLHQHYGTFARHHVETLFQPGAYWDYPHNMPRFHPRVTTCVLHCNARYSLPGHYHVDQSIVDYVCQRLRLDPYSTVMCSFALQDLDVQGDHSPFVVAVADVPSPNVTGLDRSAARDIFVLIDPRPLGLKPHFLFVHQPLVHLPTAITLLGLSTPAAARVGVQGGTKIGDDIRVDGSTALVLFAEAEDLQELASEDASQPEVSSWGESPNQVVQAYDHDLFAGAADPVEQRLDLAAEYSTWEEGTSRSPAATAPSDYQDPTLPPGHSWNAGASDNPEGAPEWTVGVVEPPTAQTAIVPSDDTTAESTRLQALVYVPDFVPEIVDVVVALPTTVFRLLSAVGSARLAEQSSSFPALYAAYPQPTREFAVFLAAPHWQIDSVSVLFDCRRTNGCTASQSRVHPSIRWV